jgi:hypothetical protein
MIVKGERAFLRAAVFTLRRDFNIYREMFYPKGKKIVPDNIGPLLSKNSLAVWFLDDKSRDKPFTYRLHTNSFTEREVDCLRQALFENFSLEAKVHKTFSSKPDTGFILYLGGIVVKNCILW